MVLVFMQQQKCFVQKSQNITLRTAHTQKVQNVYHYCEVLLFFSQQNNMYTSQHQYICYRKHSFKIRPHFQGSRRSSFQQKEKDEQKDTAFSCFEREAKTERRFLYIFITVADVGKTPQLQRTPQGIVTSALLQLAPQPSHVREG